jgi:plasmid stability protein|tara:strand:- start:113 stop:316 length:204 start_codon:yes stop_codon:yes gene_type:complete
MNDFHQTTVRLPDDLRAALKAQAALERRSMGNLIIDLCIVGLKVREQTNEDRLDEFKRLIRQTGQIA